MSQKPIIPKGFSVGYNQKAVLTLQGDISFEKGKTSILVGNNGSGKSTFLKTICGQNTEVSGTHPSWQAVYLPEELDFPAFMTAKEILHSSFPSANVYVEAAITLGVPLDKPFSHLSKGNRQKLRVVYAEGFGHLLKADVICLDEPLSGLDTLSRRLLTDIWSRKRYAGPIFSDAHRIITIHNGEAPINVQMLVAANGKMHKLPPLGICDRWIEIAIGHGVEISDF